MSSIYCSKPFKGIMELKDKFTPIDLFFTDKKIVIDGIVYADFAKPVLFPDMEYIIKHLYKNVKTITYTTEFNTRLLPKSEEEVLFLFDPILSCPEQFLERECFVMQVYLSMLIFKDPSNIGHKFTMYLCPGVGKEKITGAFQRLFIINTINKRLVDSYANWFVIMNSIARAPVN